jgi:hypothetical protein
MDNDLEARAISTAELRSRAPKGCNDLENTRDAQNWRTGMLLLGTEPELRNAITAIAEGLRSGVHRDNLRPNLETLRGALGRATRTPEGIRYLEDRPTLKQRLAVGLGKSDR